MDDITLYSLIGLASVIVITLSIIGWMIYKVFSSRQEKV